MSKYLEKKLVTITEDEDTSESVVIGDRKLVGLIVPDNSGELDELVLTFLGVADGSDESTLNKPLTRLTVVAEASAVETVNEFSYVLAEVQYYPISPEISKLVDSIKLKLSAPVGADVSLYLVFEL